MADVVGREMVQDGTEELSQRDPAAEGRMLKETPTEMHLTVSTHIAEMHFQAIGQCHVICDRWSMIREDRTKDRGDTLRLQVLLCYFV